MKRWILIITFLLFTIISYSQLTSADKEYILKYPVAVITANQKIEFAYKAQETLRLEHNRKGQEHKDGLITDAEWEDFVDNYFRPRQRAISIEVVKHKNLFKQ